LLALTRLRESIRQTRLPLPGANHLLRRAQTIVYGLEIGNEVSLGEGIDFVHPIGIVIGGNAIIGNRVRFMGNNTVGTAKENGYPTIEDDVTIGAGARILGPITIGRGSVIGANAVVVRDVPPDSVVTGIPGVARPRYVGRTGEPQ
jgi:serine O-acetyltransferase